MNKKIALGSSFLGLAMLLIFSGSLAAAALKIGYQAGDLKFVKTISETDQKYLGLKTPGPFTEGHPGQIRPHRSPQCQLSALRQEQAGAMNRLYQLVESSDLKDRVKFIGVVSNSEAAVTRWKKAYKVPFALVPDPDWEIAGNFNITGTPTTVVVGKSGKVIVLHDGVFSDAAKPLTSSRQS